MNSLHIPLSLPTSSQGLECGGPTHGTCECGTCRCRTGWSGPLCKCATTTATCMAPGVGGSGDSNSTGGTAPQLCSGRGSCECGQCHCADTFYGSFCESSATHGSNALCSFYEPCVTCLLEQAATSVAETDPDVCRQQCTSGSDGVAFRVSWVSTDVSDDVDDAAANAHQQSSAVCVLRLTSSGDQAGGGGHVCEHRFGYRVSDDTQQQRLSHLRIVRQECAEPLGAGVVFASIAVATFLIGFMGLMAVKGVHMVQDRRELARFEAEVRQTKYEEFTSPLYKSPTRVYEVPARVRNSGGGGGINDFEMNGI